MFREYNLETYKLALDLFVNWAEECDFGYDNLGDLYEKYKSRITELNLGYIEGLEYNALEEATSALREE